METKGKNDTWITAATNRERWKEMESELRLQEHVPEEPTLPAEQADQQGPD